MEYLDAGRTASKKPRRRPRRWAPVVAGVVTFFLVLVVAGAMVGDWAARNIEMRALISQVEVSEKAMGDTQKELRTVIDAFQSNTNPTDADKAAFQDKLKQAAVTGLAGVTHGGERVQSVKVLSWHNDIKAAQKAYLAHNRAWQDYLAKASKDANEFANKQDAVNETFAAAEGPMRAAVPRPDLFKLAPRVDVIYAPSEDSGPGQQA
jgi:hypothetical protein